MRIGFGIADITPAAGITLSGFVARCNEPSKKARDNLRVCALYLEDGGTRALVLSYDLLGLGPELCAQIHTALDGACGARLPRALRILCATHTHSAPATVKLIGCGVFDQKYWDLVAAQTAQAARAACESAREARLFYDRVTAAGLNYNRRKVLEDGSVVMTQFPAKPVKKEGPVWDDFLFVKAEAMDRTPIAGLVNWAAHACTVCSLDSTADFPGELMRRLEKRHGFPFMYLQGACGNLNPPFHDMTYDEMLHDVDTIETALPPLSWKPLDASLSLSRDTVTLLYQQGYSREQLMEIRDGMSRISETGVGSAAHIAVLANILNVPPNGTPDPKMLRYIARVFVEWSQGLLAKNAYDKSDGYPLAVSVLSLGEVRLVFVAAEVFIETALRIRAIMKDNLNGIVGYAGPLAGYLPPDDALDEGGYEVEHAFRFYGHPAAFAKGSEQRLLNAIKRLARF